MAQMKARRRWGWPGRADNGEGAGEAGGVPWGGEERGQGSAGGGRGDPWVPMGIGFGGQGELHARVSEGGQNICPLRLGTDTDAALLPTNSVAHRQRHYFPRRKRRAHTAAQRSSKNKFELRCAAESNRRRNKYSAIAQRGGKTCSMAQRCRKVYPVAQRSREQRVTIKKRLRFR